MSKKVLLTVSFDVEMRVRDRDVFVTAAVEKRAKKPGSAVLVSIRELANELGTSPDTARRALASSAKEGYLEVTPTHLENGGQAENSYRVTTLGTNILRAARKSGLLAESDNSL